MRLSPRRLQVIVVGRRSVPPAWWRHCRSGRQQQSRGVSDHGKWPHGLPSLRPGTWSLTPRLNRLSVPVSAPKVHPACAGGFDPQSGEELDESLSCLLTLVARVLSRAYAAWIFSEMSLHFSTNILPRTSAIT